VYCHTPTGVLASSGFTLSYVEGTAPVEAGSVYGDDYGAYAWTGGSTTGTTPLGGSYAWSGAANPPGSRQRIGPGQYVVTFDSLFFDETGAFVTAYGSTGSYCKVLDWYQWLGASANVYVECYDTSGHLADSMFDVVFQTSLGSL